MPEPKRFTYTHSPTSAAYIADLESRLAAAEAALSEALRERDACLQLFSESNLAKTYKALSEARAALEARIKDKNYHPQYTLGLAYALSLLSRPASADSPRAKLQNSAETFVTGFTGPRTAAGPATETTEAEG